MPRALDNQDRSFTILKMSLAIVCLLGLAAAETYAVTPCSAPSTTKFTNRTLLIGGIGGNLNPGNVGVGDFNNDGRADVALPIADFNMNPTNYLLVYLGNAANGLTYFGSVFVIRVPSAIAVTDFNSDGKLDLVVSNWTTVQTLVGNGAGSFSPVATYTVDNNSLAVGDFNSDGKQDIAAAPAFAVPGRVSILMGFGTGTYASPVDTPTGDGPSDIEAVDVNGDNKLDLLTVNGSNGLSVLLNNGTGAFSFPTNFPTGLSNPSNLVG